MKDISVCQDQVLYKGQYYGSVAISCELITQSVCVCALLHAHVWFGCVFTVHIPLYLLIHPTFLQPDVSLTTMRCRNPPQAPFQYY